MEKQIHLLFWLSISSPAKVAAINQSDWRWWEARARGIKCEPDNILLNWLSTIWEPLVRLLDACAAWGAFANSIIILSFVGGLNERPWRANCWWSRANVTRTEPDWANTNQLVARVEERYEITFVSYSNSKESQSFSRSNWPTDCCRVSFERRFLSFSFAPTQQELSRAWSCLQRANIGHGDNKNIKRAGQKLPKHNIALV